MRTDFNEQWLRRATLKQIRQVFKSDKTMLNKALEKRKELRK